MKKHILVLLLSAFISHFLSAQTGREKTGSKDPYSYTVFQSADKTWGYEIKEKGKVLIHQASIPALPGNKGFKTKAAAEKVAALVVTKIKKGIMPPSVSVAEMKKLKAI